MSDKKLGLWVTKGKSASQPTATAAPAGGARAKNVNKRWMMVGVGIVGAVIVSSYVLGPDKSNQPAPRTNASEGTIAVTPPGATERIFEDDYRRRLETMDAKLNSVINASNAKDREIEQLRRERDAAKNAPASAAPAGPVVLPPTPNGGGLGVLGSNGGPPAPPVPPMPTVVPTFKPPSITSAPTGSATVSAPGAAASGEAAGPMVFSAPGSSGAAASSGGSAPKLQGNAKATLQKNPSAGMLPAGAFAPVSLLNGLDAGTSSATQTSPMPMLLNVVEQATLPGAAKYRIKNCFVLATGYGDLSAERVYGRISRLSCVDKSDKLVLSQEVSGYLVDSDGKLGLRGKVTNRQGAKLHSALLAGFAQGLAGALGQAQGAVTSNLTTGMTSSNISGSAALRASGLAGAQSATNQLAEFYLKEAQSIFPVITVDAGRTATIVFTGNVSLAWGSSEGQYVQDVRPTN